MSNRYVDRGQPSRGVLRTPRDVRQDPQSLRDSQNYSFPDARPVRRPGFGLYTGDVRIQGQQLTKQTPVTQQGRRQDYQNAKVGFTEYEKHPNSYGLIRNHPDFSPRANRDWTVEFGLTLGEEERIVVSPEIRKTISSFAAAQAPVRNIEGAFVFDQTLAASHCDFNFDDGGGAATRQLRHPTLAAAPIDTQITHTDTIALTALAVAYTKTKLLATSTLIDTGEYFPYEVRLEYTWASYAAGDSHHVAVRYNTTTRVLDLVVDGVSRDTHTLAAGRKFAGEEDTYNVNQTIPINRDIVLLNECMVRGMYASTAKISHIAHGCSKFTQDPKQHTVNSHLLPPANVQFCSPPRGTAICELRIWHEERTDGELTANDWQELGALPGTLKGYWRLNDGGGTLIDQTTAERHGSVHNTYPQYIADKGLLHNQGVRFADSQYLTTTLLDTAYLSDAYSALKTCLFGHEDTITPTPGFDIQEINDFTIQMQISVPWANQGSLDLRLSSPVFPHAVEWLGSETREAPGDGSALPGGTPLAHRVKAYEIRDGAETPSSVADDVGRAERTVTAVDHQVSMFHPSWDQTLFSIEGQEKTAAADVDNHADLRRVPLIRGLLDPSNRPIFEFFADGANAQQGPAGRRGRYFRLGGTALTLSTTKTLTFRKKTISEEIAGKITRIGYRFEIWADGVLDVFLEKKVAGASPDTDTAVFSRTMEHDPVYDINIGCGYVNDHFTRSETPPIQFTDTRTVVRTPPFRHNMRRNTAYQDLPGFFTLGFFRMWVGTGISDDDIKKTWNTSIAKSRTDDQALLINLEIDQINGREILNKTEFPITFELGYKSWHVANGDKTFTVGDFAFEEHTWAFEDCLGYGELPAAKYTPTKATDVPCNFLGFYQAVITQTSGLLAIYKDTPFFDDEVDGTLLPVYTPVTGLLNEFSAGHQWQGTNIGDRLYLTAYGALPKVFDGKSLAVAGLPEYRGPIPIIESHAPTPSPATGLTVGSYYGVILVYFSELDNVSVASSRSVVKIDTGDDSIWIREIPPHPDPRVSSFRIFRTAAQASLDDARTAPLFLIPDGPFTNKHDISFFLAGADGDLLVTTFDFTVTRVPIAALGAQLNGRLFLTAGIVGDTLYWSDAGNPQRFDAILNQIVIKPTGEANNGILSLFGSIFVFKPSSLFRVDDRGNNQFIDTEVAGIGAVSSRSIAVVTMQDDGRTVIIFWSKFGPYMFDGSRLNYIGYPIEVDRINGKPYDWLEPETVFVLQHPQDRELIFFYKTRDPSNGNIKDRHDAAVVFNSRFNTWYFYGQTVASYATSICVSNSETIAAIEAGGATPEIPVTPTQKYRPLVGASNGHLYEWGTASTDGLRVGAVTNTAIVLSYTPAIITLTTAPYGASDILRGNWVTVMDPATRISFSMPILTNTANTITLDTVYGGVLITPKADDLIWVGQPPAFLEYAWDVMDNPGTEKSINEMLLWSHKTFYFRESRDWGRVAASAWTLIADAVGKRVLRHPQVLVEAFKLELLSSELDSRVDQLAYRVADKVAPSIT